MVIVLPQGRSEHNYAWPETYSVMIHHAVSGCFTCRKIICFNLPSLQIHREHHILCKKLLWVAALSSPLHQALLWFWFFFFFPLPSLLLGISFQKKALEVSVSKKGFLLVSVSPHIAQTVPTQRSSHPHAHVTPLSITAFPLCCRATQILQCRKAWCRLFPSLLAEWFNKFTLEGTWIYFFLFKWISTGHRACTEGEKGVLPPAEFRVFSPRTKCIFCKQVFLKTLYALKGGAAERGRRVSGSLQASPSSKIL